MLNNISDIKEEISDFNNTFWKPRFYYFFVLENTVPNQYVNDVYAAPLNLTLLASNVKGRPITSRSP